MLQNALKAISHLEITFAAKFFKTLGSSFLRTHSNMKNPIHCDKHRLLPVNLLASVTFTVLSTIIKPTGRQVKNEVTEGDNLMACIIFMKIDFTF